MSSNNWPLWEIFIRSKNGLAHKHAGSLHAADAKMAIENARDVYTRRMEGVSIWVVRSADIVASSPADKDLCMNRPTTKFIVIRPSMRYLLKLDICDDEHRTELMI